MNTDLLLIVGFVTLLIVLGVVVRFFSADILPLWKAQLIANGMEWEASLLERLAETAVQYAEQVGVDNAHKKELAMRFIVAEAQRYDVHVDAERAEAFVESAVRRVLTHFLPLPSIAHPD